MRFLRKYSLTLKLLIPSLLLMVFIVTGKSAPQRHEDSTSEERKVKVETLHIQTSDHPVPIAITGVANPKIEIDLVSEVSGAVKSVHKSFVVGGKFKKGMVLMELENTPLKTALALAQARLSQARADYEQELGLANSAEQDIKGAHDLREFNNQRASDLYLRKPQLIAALQMIESAQAEVELATFQLERSVIRAAFDGEIESISVNLGQYITAGTAIARIFETSAAEVLLQLNNKEFSALGIHNITDTTNLSAEVFAQYEGHSYSWSASDIRTLGSLDERTRMHRIILEIQNPYSTNELPLKKGMFVNGLIYVNPEDNLTRLPASAVFNRDQIYFIENDEVKLSHVDVVYDNQEYVWFKLDDSLKNKQVVVKNQQLVTPGTQVMAIPSSSLL